MDTRKEGFRELGKAVAAAIIIIAVSKVLSNTLLSGFGDEVYRTLFSVRSRGRQCGQHASVPVFYSVLLTSLIYSREIYLSQQRSFRRLSDWHWSICCLH